jgi:glycosyltransferase involved in cell wall biosynthesis
MRPEVTIGMCARNCGSILGSAIESVIAQDYPHSMMELIIVDDGSEDDTLAVIKSYAGKTDIPLIVFSHEWRGLGFSRNFVVQHARGDYVIWVDCDETIENNYVRKQVEFLDTHPRIGISVGILVMPEYNLIRKLDLMPFLVDRIRFIAQGSELKAPGTGASAFRVKALQDVGGFDETMKGAGEDLDIGYRIKSSGWLVGAVNARFWETRGGIRTLRELWNRYLGYGYGNHKVHLKHKEAVGYETMNPLAGMVSGLLYAVEACRLTGEKRLLFLLPVTFAFKYTAWCLGFTKSHLEKGK